jgi:hypothetical protein
MARRAEAALACTLTLCALATSTRAQTPSPVTPTQTRAARAVRIDGLAALVGGLTPGPDVAAILRSDVELRARLALSARATDEVVMGELPQSLLRATLDALIGEHLIAREAQRVRVAQPGRRRVALERKRIERAAGGTDRVHALLAKMGATNDELDAIAERRALVGAFLQANLEGETVVTNAQVEREYTQREAQFEGRPRREVLRELRAELARRALDAAVHRWVEMLGKRTPVRIHADYDDA